MKPRCSIFLVPVLMILCSSSHGYRSRTEAHGPQDGSPSTEDTTPEGTAAERPVDYSSGPITRTTKTGHAFTRDESRPDLGEAWRDPIGVVWSAIAKNKDGSPLYMTHRNAVEYCRKLGAELPHDTDFIRLRRYLGGRPGFEHEYSPQILPDLGVLVDGQYVSQEFWSSSRHPRFSDQSAYFLGLTGGIAYEDNRPWVLVRKAVRCVGRAAIGGANQRLGSP